MLTYLLCFLSAELIFPVCFPSDFSTLLFTYTPFTRRNFRLDCVLPKAKYL